MRHTNPIAGPQTRRATGPTATLLVIPILLMAWCCAASATMRMDTDLGGLVKVNSTARLLAGLPPVHPGHRASADSAAWKEHSAAMNSALSRLKSDRVASMVNWRDNALAGACSTSKTLFYPFSGPDFFNAHLLFPDCDNYILFGLEHVGNLPDIESISERDLVRLLTDVRRSVSDLFDRNYFITENMSRQLRTSQLRGVLPLLVIPMALSGVEILRIVPNEFAQHARSARVARKRAAAAASAPGAAPDDQVQPKTVSAPIRHLAGVTIEFRKPRETVVQRVHYFSVDATDDGLAHYPEFLGYLKQLGPTNTFVKAASYLLHGSKFLQLRRAMLEISELLVQDDTGVPYNLLAGQWDVHLYGRYETPIRPFQRAYQPLLDRAFKDANPNPLSFEFGYNYSDKRDNRSNVLVGRRITGPDVLAVPERTAHRSSAVLKASAWMDQVR